MTHDNDSAAGVGDIDLTQFYQVFFEEAAENLDSFEHLLLALDVDAPIDEAMNAIFRCAHSIKGGAATFGFTDVAELTHAMETLLDRLRRGEQQATTPMVDTLLKAGDALRALMHRHQHGGDTHDCADILAALLAHMEKGSDAPAAEREANTSDAPQATPSKAAAGKKATAAGERDLELLAGPLEPMSLADDLVELFGEVTGVGTIERMPDDGLAKGMARFRFHTTATDGDVLDLCSFHVPREQIRLADWPGTAQVDAAPAAVTVAPPPAAAARTPAPAPVHADTTPKRAAVAPSETLRVSVDKVDQLINLMGELVITQAMLAQRAAGLDAHSRELLLGGLGDLERTTRDLQESVMSIRMIPMADVFNRFPRMLRDLAARLGKQLEFRTVGESTEMDKGLIEKITDPLTHLVRNSLDHGIELPADRIAQGKPAHGTLTLGARHEGGCIVIEVRDDGRGLNRQRLLGKAVKNGMAVSDAMPDSDVFNLIFAPGFSTVDEVTDISGRGVGMDVVRRNILGLGGAVELDSTPGVGTCVRVRLPLTLAIMDGMSVGVDNELYLLPLPSIVESFQPKTGAIRTMSGGRRVVKVRDDYVPVVTLAQAMNAAPHAAHSEPRVLVLVQAEGRLVALEVERLIGQQQVVVKNLETNYRKVAGVSGATIMGDGSVALILDASALVRAAHSHSSPGDPGRHSLKGGAAAHAEAQPITA
ncbi:MAG: chemotaxis protein CheW [Ramlibacter sp.]|nr:chemotaxis protein CheW [Ramlibacter sp.]